RVLVDLDAGLDRDDFAGIVVATGGAHVMRALELAAAAALAGIGGHEEVVGAAPALASLGDLVLRDGHVTTSIDGGEPDPRRGWAQVSGRRGWRRSRGP